MRIRTSVFVALLSIGLPAALHTETAYAQAAQPTAQELYDSGMEAFSGDIDIDYTLAGDTESHSASGSISGQAEE